LEYLDTVVQTLAAFCRSLEREFSVAFQTNAYLTPARAQGAKYHYDSHDVFVLQIAGSKHWTISGTPVELPLRGQDFDPSEHERGQPTLDFELEAGDFAYIPRGVVHDARSSESTSLHITVGVLLVPAQTCCWNGLRTSA
jgi:ribosomal protein L16 Arg81 hydroxylase